jgi:MGT family glycosyltransferase
LHLPTVSSLAIFSGLKNFLDRGNSGNTIPGAEDMMKSYKEMAVHIKDKYGVQLPDSVFGLLFNKGDVNFIYTSEYFILPADREFFDDTYQFVGPPIYQRKEDLNFPYDKLTGNKVIYISLVTVYGNARPDIYDIFFKSFSNTDAIVVMAAYNVDLIQLNIPDNFIVRNYVPQSALLKYTSVAITHAGMNSLSDLIYNGIPFVAIPLGADQPALARRAEDLGAAIVLDVATLDAQKLKDAVEKVSTDPGYRQNIEKINRSFHEAGGYPKAVAEIFNMKKAKGIIN